MKTRPPRVRRSDGKIIGAVVSAGDKQFRATTSGGRNLGYFRSAAAAQRALVDYDDNLTCKKQEKYA